MGYLIAASNAVTVPGTDFFSRLSRFLSLFGPAAILIAVIVIAAIAWQAVRGRRIVLFGVIVLSFPFSGAISFEVDTATVMLRWYAIALLAVSVLALRRFPGKAWLAYFGFVLLGTFLALASLALGEIPIGAMQLSVLVFGVTLAVGSLAGHINDRADLTKICGLFVVAAAIWAIVTGVYIPSLGNEGVITGAGRFTGASGSGPVVAMTGATLLPFALWGALFPWARMWRILSGALFVVMVICLLATTQRTGIFGGTIACIPLLVRHSLKKLIVVVLLVASVAGTGYYLASRGREHAKFVGERITTFDTGGRAGRWAFALEQIRQAPLWGRGHGVHDELATKHRQGVHNAYLAIWYNTGLVGIVLVFAAFVITTLQASRGIMRPPDPETLEFAKLFLGLLMGVTAMGLAETSFAASSNITAIALVLTFVGVARLTAMAGEQTGRRQPQLVRLVARPAN